MKTIFYSFKKFRKTNLDVNNGVFSKPVKFQLEIPYMLGRAKNDKSGNLK
jgi:hypothetical protein